MCNVFGPAGYGSTKAKHVKSKKQEENFNIVAPKLLVNDRLLALREGSIWEIAAITYLEGGDVRYELVQTA